MTADVPEAPQKWAEMNIRQVANGYFIESEPRQMGMTISFDKIYVAGNVGQLLAVIADLLHRQEPA